MARSALTKTTSSRNLTGINLGTTTFTTLATGAGNGKYWTHSGNDLILLKNDTGGPATFTLVFTTPAEYTRYSLSVASPTLIVADGKVYALRLGDLMTDASGQINIDCDVAGKIAVLDCP